MPPRIPPTLDVNIQLSLRNALDLEGAKRRAIVGGKAVQPTNTRKTYKKPQRLWREWCKERGFQDGEFVKEEKLLLWLEDVVLKLTVGPKRGMTREFCSTSANRYGGYDEVRSGPRQEEKEGNFHHRITRFFRRATHQGVTEDSHQAQYEYRGDDRTGAG